MVDGKAAFNDAALLNGLKKSSWLGHEADMAAELFDPEKKN